MKQLLLIFTMLLLSACGNSKPEKIEDLRSTIIKIQDAGHEVENDSLVIWIKSDSVFKTSVEATQTFKGIREHFPEAIADKKYIRVITDSNLIDQYNNKIVKSTFMITWLAEDIKKINFEESADEFIVLNLAIEAEPSLQAVAAGRELLTTYCQRNSRSAGAFCNKATR